MNFIISAPRSGSTWLARGLNQHPSIVATENRLFGQFFDVWRNRNGRQVPRITADQFTTLLSRHSFHESLGFQSTAEMQSALFKGYLEFLLGFIRQASGKSVIVDKITPYLGTSQLVIKQIQEHFPNAKIVHLIRDGRDVATSGVFDWLGRESEPNPRTRFFLANQPGLKLTRFFDDQALTTWASYWQQPIQAVTSAAAETLQVRYEQMIQCQADVLRQVFEFLQVEHGQDLADRCAEHVTFERITGREPGESKPVSKTRRGVIGDWKNYFTRADGERFHQLVGQHLVELRYVDHSKWFEALPEELDLNNQTTRAL